jgi:hypothetical protein
MLNSTNDSLFRIEKPDREIEGEEPVSKVESARVILAPKGAVLLRGRSGLNLRCNEYLQIK